MKQRFLNILKAFTLAEVMIVLTVIGVLAGILVPVANNARPDENVMKFKKAHATLFNVVREMVNSDKYYRNGDLGVAPDGNLIGKSRRDYFCETFSDVVSTKRKLCDYDITVSQGLLITHIGSGDSYVRRYTDDEQGKLLDKKCLDSQKAYNGDILGVMTTDNIYYYEENLQNPFGCIVGQDCVGDTLESWNGERLFSGKPSLVNIDGLNTYRHYKGFCIDIDGINKGEDPFGYAIRVDGKIILGKRAQEWLEKDFQKGKNNN